MLAAIQPLPVDDPVDPDLLPGTLRRTKKLGGNIAGKLDGQYVFPERFAVLKREICKDPALFEARWRSILNELEKETKVIAQRGGDVSMVCWPRDYARYKGHLGCASSLVL